MKHLSILVLDSQTNLSTVACVVGAFEFFSEANQFWNQQGKEPIFKVDLVGVSKSESLSGQWVSVHPSATLLEVPQTDLIIIPSSLVRNYEMASAGNQSLIRWVEGQYRLGAEVASMCTGTFFLASTGLLSNRQCSTHWAASEHFRNQFPEVDLQTDKLITDEMGIYTNGGAYSFLHLILYLIEKHYDRPTAVYCAKVFQIDLDRNLQAGFSIFQGHKQHSDEAVQQAQAYIEQEYPSKISFESLSSSLHIGRRNFDRRFIKATGITPLDYLQRVRIEAAKKTLESTRKTVNEVMYEVGYNDTKAFREVFVRVTGMSPLEYKAKYNRERV